MPTSLTLIFNGGLDIDFQIDSQILSVDYTCIIQYMCHTKAVPISRFVRKYIKNLSHLQAYLLKLLQKRKRP